MSICKSRRLRVGERMAKRAGRMQRPEVTNLRDLKQIRSEALVGVSEEAKEGRPQRLNPFLA